MPILIDLFLTFIKIGLMGFGGGYAMISILQNVAIERGWMTISEFSDMVAVSEMTPGPIAVNMATFVGFREAGVGGSLLATLGVSLPSFTLVLITVKFFMKYKESKTVEDVFYGLRPAVVGLIFAAFIRIALPEFLKNFNTEVTQMFEFRSIAICIAAFFVVYKFKANPIIVILLSAVVGIIIF